MAQEENRALNRIIEVFSSGVDLDRVLSAAVDLVLETTGVDACFLHLYEPEGGGRLVLREASEPYRDAIGKVKLALGEGVSGWVAVHREPVVIAHNKWADARYKYIPALGGDRVSSVIPITETSEESFSSAIASLVSGGSTRRTACGSTTHRIALL